MSTITRLFSKILVNRLQPIFSTIISEDQQGFIHGRSSHFNIQRLQQSDAFTLVSPSKKRRRGYPSPARQQPTTSIQPLKEHSFNAYTLLPDEEEYHTPTPSPKAKAKQNEAEKHEDEDHDMEAQTSSEGNQNKNTATSNTNDSPIKLFNPTPDQLKKTDGRTLIPPTK
ncbi:unnamed protein product [Ambrosiozyma monospora]|uniref:Unnamed protein product n=1 Tax=Ambrosiozyma monospora TaxID=43982 RepID=A0A9W6YUM9_AMBMO|nr:unnamed protein product [Ambrosiozyma monospora]